MKSIKQKVMQNRIQVQIQNKQKQLNEINQYKNKITDVYWYLYSIAEKVFKEQSQYIEKMDSEIESSALGKPKEVLKLNWIKESIDVEYDEHLKNIDDIGFRMINMYSKDWLAEYKPLTDLIANLNLKFKDKSWVEYAERSFENDWLIVNVKACCYGNEFGNHYTHEIEYKYTNKFKSKIIGHYKNEGLKVFENENGVFVTL